MASDGRKTKMKDADIHKVDLVPAGAQQHSKISIFKSADGEDKSFVAKIFESIQKALTGFTITPVDEKQPDDFNDELYKQKVENAMCEMWDYTYALREAIKSIICSDDSDKVVSVKASIEQFSNAIQTAIPKWLNGERVAKSMDNVDKFKEMHQSLSKLIETSSQVVKSIDNIEPDKAEKVEGSVITMAEPINKSALSQEVQDYIASLEEKVAKAAQPPMADPNAEDIYKGLSEPVVKMLKDLAAKNNNLEAQNNELAKSVAKMSDDKLVSEYVAKAATFDKLGIKPDEFGVVLKSIATISPEVYAKVEAVLKSANEAITKGKLFNEIGSGANNGATTTKEDAWNQIVALADARVTKGEDKTQAQAIEAVMKTAEGGKLYAIYVGK